MTKDTNEGMDISYNFSRWILRDPSAKAESDRVIDVQKMTVEAIEFLHSRGVQSLHLSLEHQASVVDAILGAYMHGVCDGYGFLHDLIQDEKVVM